MFTALRVAALAGVSFIAAGVAFAQDAARGALPAVPAGITMQPLGKDQGFDTGKSTAGYLAREQIAFTDPRGKTLYTYKKDPAGKSACVAACAETWPPALAPSYAAPFGAWSVITRTGAPAANSAALVRATLPPSKIRSGSSGRAWTTVPSPTSMPWCV